MDPKDWKRDETPKHFINPLNIDVIIDYREDDNKMFAIILEPLQVATFPAFLAENLINHLLDAIVNERNLGYITPEQRAELRKEVEVES